MRLRSNGALTRLETWCVFVRGGDFLDLTFGQKFVSLPGWRALSGNESGQIWHTQENRPQNPARGWYVAELLMQAKKVR